MKFGRLADVHTLPDFSLPQEDPANTRVLSALRKKQQVVSEDIQKPNVYVGCPVWGEDSFLGKLYAPDTKPKERLYKYGEQFLSIELNSTYYHLSLEQILGWKEQVPAHFKFCPKIPKIISHDKGLKNVKEDIQYFYKVVEEFEETLGHPFLLLPPHFGPDQWGLLELFVSRSVAWRPLAIELRHPDWYVNKPLLQKVFQLFEEYNVTSVITDTPGRRDVLHQRLTGDTVMIRFKGLNGHPTDFERMNRWVEQLQSWFEQGLQTVYFFMHQEEKHLAIDASIYFIEKLNQVCGLNIEPPTIWTKPQQSLF
jgi:uncharacterized protein YecE (DUF72 family)